MNAKFDVTQYEHFNAFRKELIHICNCDDVKQLRVHFNHPKTDTFLWMREAPALFGSNLCAEVVFDGFAFYEPHSLSLIFQALEIGVSARSERVFQYLWRLAGNRAQRQPQVDFLIHYFKNETPEHVSEHEKTIVLTALNSLRPAQREQLCCSKVGEKPLFIELWARSQNHVLNQHVETGATSGARKL